MKTLNKKLQINKKTISKLNDMELDSLKGGSNYCTGSTCPGGTSGGWRTTDSWCCTRDANCP